MGASAKDDLFRFVLFRAPRALPAGSAIEMPLESAFARDVARTLAVDRARAVADAFVTGPQFLQDVTALQLGPALAAALAEAHVPDSVASFAAWVEARFGLPAAKLAADGVPRSDLLRVLDSLLAIKLARGRFAQTGALLRCARLLFTIGEVAAGRVDDAGLARALTALIVFPSLEPQRAPTQPPPAQPPGSAPPPAAPLSAAALRRALADVQLAITRRLFAPVAPTKLRVTPINSAAPRFFGAPRPSREGPLDLEPPKLQTLPFTLSEAARRNLSAETSAVIQRLGIELAERPAWNVANLLHEALLTAGPHIELDGVYFYDGAPVFVPGTLFPLFPPTPSPVPTTTGDVRPAGVGDLLVVRQQIVRYEPTEVAQIDNLARGASRVDERRRLDISEEIIFAESERTEVSEREQSKSERFELRQEAERTLREDSALKAGVSISASYGPSVEFSASVEASYERSTEESTQRAVEYGKDVVDRSASRVSERVLARREQRFRRETEQKHQDRRDNTGGAEHIRGVFQWVDKVYEAQVYNYGKRLMFDFMVPEPAALLRHALTRSRETTRPAPVEPLVATAADIDEDTYMALSARYGATDVRPPPEPYVTISATFAKVLDGGVEGKRIAEEKTLDIPAGYGAAHCYVDLGLSRGGAWWFDVWVGQEKYQNRHDRTDFDRGPRFMSGERGSVPLGLHGGGVNAYTVMIEVLCQLTPMAKDQWRLDTLQKIREAYELRLREREEALALAENAAGGVSGAGQNPAVNRATERSELKRACISLLGAQRYEQFDATRTLPGSATPSYPEIDFTEASAEGAYVRFFEQAFEWEQMTYLLYPYFWSRKQNWLDRLLDRDADPLFAEFLKAGTARTQVPVRPGFESAVLHFLETGRVWNGSDEPPPLGTPLYLAMVDEIRARTAAGTGGLPVGAPWEVRVPTELTWLRRAETLPIWTQRDGVWTPDDGA